MSADNTDDGSDGDWVLEPRLPHPVTVKMPKKQSTTKPEEPPKKQAPTKKKKKKISKTTQEIHFTFSCDHCGHDTVIALRHEGLKKKKTKKKKVTPAPTPQKKMITTVDQHEAVQRVLANREATETREQQQHGYGTEWKPKQLNVREGFDQIYLPMPQQPQPALGQYSSSLI